MGNKKATKRLSARRAATFLAALGALVLSSGVVLMATATSANAAVSVTFCHSTSSETNEWNEITTDANAFYEGHVLQQHTADIYPSVDFTHGQDAVHVDAQGDQAILANHCVAPEAPAVCPEGTDHVGEEIPEGETAESFCNDVVSPPAVCPEGTDHVGEEIPEGETAESFCDDEVVVTPPVVSPPKVNPPKKHTTTVTPTVVHAGLAGVSSEDMRGEQGLALMFAGMLMLVAAGGLGLRVRGSESRI